MATSTPRPTNTPTTTPTRAATAAAPPVVDRDTAGGPRTATITQPANNHSSNTATIFKWVADAPLAAGQEFEIVFWKASGENEGDGRGIFHSSPATEVTQPLNALAPDTYRWALLLVQPAPRYERIRTLAGPFTLTVPSGSGSGGGGGSGSGSGSGGGGDGDGGSDAER
jgi:hypothetical protein